MEGPDKKRNGASHRYVLRRAGGSLWLVDTEQPGVPYRPPVQMNETGAMIWQLWQEGLSDSEIAARIGEQAEIPAGEILPDVKAFLTTLKGRLDQ